MIAIQADQFMNLNRISRILTGASSLPVKNFLMRRADWTCAGDTAGSLVHGLPAVMKITTVSGKLHSLYNKTIHFDDDRKIALTIIADKVCFLVGASFVIFLGDFWWGFEVWFGGIILLLFYKCKIGLISSYSAFFHQMNTITKQLWIQIVVLFLFLKFWNIWENTKKYKGLKCNLCNIIDRISLHWILLNIPSSPSSSPSLSVASSSCCSSGWKSQIKCFTNTNQTSTKHLSTEVGILHKVLHHVAIKIPISIH